MTFIDTDKDRYEFDFIYSHGNKYVEITHHYQHDKWSGHTWFAVKIENKVIQWDDTHPPFISKEAISYITRIHKNKTFL